MESRQHSAEAARWFVGAGLFSLAAALVYFSLQIVAIVGVVEKILPLAPQLMAQSDAWREQAGRGISLAETQTPAALNTIDQTRQWLQQQSPLLLTEVAEIRALVDKQLPPLIAQVGQLQKQLPALLQETAALRKSLPAILAESSAIRESVPPILSESAALRKDIPVILAQADQLADKAGEAGRKATQGAVTGVFRMPLDMLLGAGNFLLGGKNLSKSEIDALTHAGDKLLVQGAKVGDSQPFNASTGLSGSLSITEKIDKHCWRITARGSHKNQSATASDFRACKNSDGAWDYSPMEAQ